MKKSIKITRFLHPTGERKKLTLLCTSNSHMFLVKYLRQRTAILAGSETAEKPGFSGKQASRSDKVVSGNAMNEKDSTIRELSSLSDENLRVSDFESPATTGPGESAGIAEGRTICRN